MTEIEVTNFHFEGKSGTLNYFYPWIASKDIIFMDMIGQFIDMIGKEVLLNGLFLPFGAVMVLKRP